MLFTDSWLTVDTFVELDGSQLYRWIERRKVIEMGWGGVTVKEQLCSKDIEVTGVIPPANSDVLSCVQAAETAPQSAETIEQ